MTAIVAGAARGWFRTRARGAARAGAFRRGLATRVP
jgi:hypothetical protein